jgi:hypothetical protein
MPEQNGQLLEDINTAEVPRQERAMRSETSQLLEARRAEIDAEWREVVAFSTVETAAALNYWRGRAEEYNAFRETLMRQHPDREKDLPPALQVDEIQVRQVVLEQEMEHQKSAEIAQ